MEQSAPHKYVNIEFTETMQQRSSALLHEPVSSAILDTTYSTEYVSPDDVMYFPSFRLPTLAACGIEKWHVWTCKGSETESLTALTPYVHPRVGGMTDVGFDVSWEVGLFDRVPVEMPNRYLVAGTCVLTHMTRATNHLDKDLSSVEKPNQPRRTGLRPSLRNSALTVTSVDVTLDLYLGDVVVSLRPTEETIMESVVCVLFVMPVARVI